jgi:hypothetical protein
MTSQYHGCYSTYLRGNCCNQFQLFSLSLDSRNSRMCILYEWSCVTMKLNRLLRIEHDPLFRINFKEIIFQCPERKRFIQITGLLFSKTIDLANSSVCLLAVLPPFHPSGHQHLQPYLPGISFCHWANLPFHS